jgi:Tfp pilus assembly protein PilE
MGQQQLLLIILGVIIVGIAVAVGITMFQDNAVDQNRNMVIADLQNLAAKAQQYYAKPTTLGGGGNTFTPAASPLTADPAGLAVLAGTAFTDNANGKYSITAVAAQSITLLGNGKTATSETKYPSYTLVVGPTVTTLTKNADVATY